MKINKLNLGCGRDYREDWLNWDVSTEVKADRHFDICRQVWPTPTASISEIYCSGVLEQILENKDLVHVMNECHRVLIASGRLTVIVPSARYRTAFQDPHDVRQFTEETFQYFNQSSRYYQLYGSIYGYLPWVLLDLTTNPRGIMTALLAKTQ